MSPVRLFSFAALNDLHHHTPECSPWFARLFGTVAASPAEFTLLLGDLAHRGAPASFEAVRRLAKEAGLTVFPVPGNHDNDLEANTGLYAAAFPGRLNYHFVHQDWLFIGLDTTQGKDWHDTRVPAATLAWLDTTLPSLDHQRPTVVFTHFPLVPGVRGPTGELMTLLDAEALLERFEAFNLRAVLSGHFHGRRASAHRLATVATHDTCSRVDHNHDGTDGKGWRLCHAHADGTLTCEPMALPAA